MQRGIGTFNPAFYTNFCNRALAVLKTISGMHTPCLKMIIVQNLHVHLVFFGSQDCVHWGLLPVVTESMRHNCSFVKGRFTGDPSYEYEHTETKAVENQDGDKVDGAEEENIVCKVLSFGCNDLKTLVDLFNQIETLDNT